MNELTHLDLFSGIGGFALAAQRAGFRTVGFSEVEPYACRVLAERFPGVPNLGDVRKPESFAGVGSVTVLTGGFPCQPWSVAGKQRGAADDRHLWPAMLGVIEDVRPAWIIGENVPGIVGVGLERVCLDLEGFGYSAQPFIIPACAVGAPHVRERVWILCHSNAVRRLEQEGRKPDERRRDMHTDWWKAQPEPPRVDDGLSRESYENRRKALGNAIVPQVAEPFFHWIAQIERGEIA